jgi:predicted Fe-Mo cluster-binding NifX family protein
MADIMKVAIPSWMGRVSPVFDEASRVLVFDISDGRVVRSHEELLTEHSPFERAQLFPKLGVSLLICGMISQTQKTALDSAGIRVIPHICGRMDEVIAAFMSGRIEDGALLMPGCGGRKKFRHRKDGRNREAGRCSGQDSRRELP